MTPGEITMLLRKRSSDDPGQLDAIYAALYQEIKVIAGHQLRSLNPGQTITPTALSNECYLKLAQLDSLPATDKRHFMLYLSRAMRSFLIDSVRQKKSQKRNGIEINTGISQLVGNDDIAIDLMDIDRILNTIEAVDVRLAEILQTKLIFGLTFREIGEFLSLSERQVIRLWNQAKALALTLSEPA